jgi:Fe-S-cluster containining protein
MLTIDISYIKQTAQFDESANSRFVDTLKECPQSNSSIDTLVQTLFKEVSAQIDCTACGHCCTQVGPLFDTRDIEALATFCGLSPEQFEHDYLLPDKDSGGLYFNQTPCPFWNNKHCTVYEYRPEDCRSFPHFHLKNFRSRAAAVCETISLCPIVFHVWYKLRKKIETQPESKRQS